MCFTGRKEHIASTQVSIRKRALSEHCSLNHIWLHKCSFEKLHLIKILYKTLWAIFWKKCPVNATQFEEGTYKVRIYLFYLGAAIIFFLNNSIYLAFSSDNSTIDLDSTAMIKALQYLPTPGYDSILFFFLQFLLLSFSFIS